LAGAFAVACGGDDNGGVHGAVFGNDGGNLGDGTILGDGSIAPSDSGTDGSSILPDGGGCVTGTVAVFGGGSSGAFGSIASGSGAFTTQNFAGDAVVALPSVIAFGSGFQAVFHVGGSNALMSSAYASPSWSTPAVISGTLVREMPTLAIEGSTLHVVYQANDDAGADEFKYFHGTLGGSTWTAGDPMGTGVGQSDGPHPPGAAGLASELVTGQVGGDNGIYARSFTTSWQAAVPVLTDAGDDTNLGSDALVLAMNGGTAELMMVYTRKGDFKLMAITRTTGTWALAPVEINTTAFATEPFQATAISGGGAIVTWRGSDTHGYVSVFNGTTWSTPYALAPFAINSSPSVAVGNCGSVAIATYAKSTGAVETIRFDGTNWANVESVTGAANASFVAIAVTP
jgi:hypothetical protein